MNRYLVALAVVVLSSVYAEAGPFGLFRRGGTTNNQGNYSGGTQQVTYNRPFLGTAQAAAHYMASICRMGHFGGNSGYEGVGVGSTPYQAEMNCCYRNKWAPREVGIAQGANGLWYACCRY